MMTEERDYTTQDVTTLTNAQLVEEALQSADSAGFEFALARFDNAIPARDRRNACFAEITRRLAQARRLAEALVLAKPYIAKQVADIESAIEQRVLDKMEAALAAWQAPSSDAGQGKEEKAPPIIWCQPCRGGDIKPGPHHGIHCSLHTHSK